MSGLWFEELDEGNQSEVSALILAGLAEHWGIVDQGLNRDLEDMTASYRDGRTVVMRDADGALVGTGTVVPRSGNKAEILRMSVAGHSRRSGAGQQIVKELVATARSWNAQTVILETSSAWEDVIQFYLQCGFTISHTEEGPFGSETWFELSLDPVP